MTRSRGCPFSDFIKGGDRRKLVYTYPTAYVNQPFGEFDLQGGRSVPQQTF